MVEASRHLSCLLGSRATAGTIQPDSKLLSNPPPSCELDCESSRKWFAGINLRIKQPVGGTRCSQIVFHTLTHFNLIVMCKKYYDPLRG